MLTKKMLTGLKRHKRHCATQCSLSFITNGHKTHIFGSSYNNDVVHCFLSSFFPVIIPHPQYGYFPEHGMLLPQVNTYSLYPLLTHHCYERLLLTPHTLILAHPNVLHGHLIGPCILVMLKHQRAV